MAEVMIAVGEQLREREGWGDRWLGWIFAGPNYCLYATVQ